MKYRRGRGILVWAWSLAS